MDASGNFPDNSYAAHDGFARRMFAYIEENDGISDPKKALLFKSRGYYKTVSTLHFPISRF